MSDRADQIGTIENTRKMLAFLETLPEPSETVQNLVRRYRAEVRAYGSHVATKGKLYRVLVRDRMDIYPSLESFRFEIETMVEAYGLPADVEEITAIEGESTATLEPEVEAGERRSSPTGSLPSPSDFHDVAGANLSR
jgi:hypothetical protein